MRAGRRREYSTSSYDGMHSRSKKMHSIQNNFEVLDDCVRSISRYNVQTERSSRALVRPRLIYVHSRSGAQRR